jgi:hypothetical protein
MAGQRKHWGNVAKAEWQPRRPTTGSGPARQWSLGNELENLARKNEVERNTKKGAEGTYKIRGGIAHNGHNHLLLHLSGFGGIEQTAQLTTVVVIEV